MIYTSRVSAPVSKACAACGKFFAGNHARYCGRCRTAEAYVAAHAHSAWCRMELSAWHTDADGTRWRTLTGVAASCK